MCKFSDFHTWIFPWIVRWLHILWCFRWLMINLFFIKIYLDIFIKDYFKLKLFILKILLLLKWRIHWPAFSFDIFQELWVLKNEINCHLEIREKNIWWIMFQLSAIVRVIYWFLWNMLWCMFSYKKKWFDL